MTQERYVYRLSILCLYLYELYMCGVKFEIWKGGAY